MKLNSIEINERTYPVVITDVFDTNNCFRANMVIDGYDVRTDENNRVINAGKCKIRGVNIDMSDLELLVDIDCVECNGDWTLIYVYSDL